MDSIISGLKLNLLRGLIARQIHNAIAQNREIQPFLRSINPLHPAMWIGRNSALDIDQCATQFLSCLPGATRADAEFTFG
jgi:hypothetical protein